MSNWTLVSLIRGEITNAGNNGGLREECRWLGCRRFSNE